MKSEFSCHRFKDDTVLGCHDVCFGIYAPFQRNKHLQGGKNFNLEDRTVYSSNTLEKTAVSSNTTTDVNTVLLECICVLSNVEPLDQFS
jgi:hypothetical protein